MNARITTAFTFFLLVLVTLCSPITRAAEPTSQPQKIVVCFGDSITKIGFGDFLGKYVQAQVVNSGVSGQTSLQGLKRLQKEVLDHHPDVVVILFGTNDMVRDQPEPKVDIEHYKANLVEMIDAITKQGGQVVLCTVPPINAEPYFKRHPQKNYDAAGGLEKIIGDYRQAVLDLAKDRKLAAVDLNAILTKQPEWQGPDGVHPTKDGRLILAKAIAPAVNELLGTSDTPATQPR